MVLMSWSNLTRKLLSAGFILALTLPLIATVSCGREENMSPPKISTGNAMGDKLINAMHVQLKVRLFLKEDVIASYLKQSVVSGESLSFDGLDFRAPLSADAKAYARIVFGLIREIDKLSSVYSYGNADMDAQSKKLRENIVKLALTYTRVFTQADYASSGKKAELGFATAYASVAGFPALGLSDALKEAGLKEIETAVLAAVAAAKWSPSESVTIYPDTASALLIGLRGIELTKDLRIKIMGDFSLNTGNAINELEKDNAAFITARIQSVIAKTSLYLGLLKNAGFTEQEVPDAVEPLLEKTISLLHEISAEKLTESTLTFATRIVDVTSPFLASVQAEEAKQFCRKLSYRLIKDYKEKATTLPDGFVSQVQTTMTSRINSSSLVDSIKTAAVTGIEEGVTQIQDELNPPADPPDETYF